MNYDELLSMFDIPACIIRVTPVGDSYGDIRIHKANKLYKETMGPNYYDDMLYYNLVPKDLKFENFCYQAAVKKQKMHAYVETKALGTWTDQTLIPVKDIDDKYKYCIFIFRFTKTADASMMADVSMDNARICIECCIKLHVASNFYEGLDAVTYNLMKHSKAFSAIILMLDNDNKEIRLLGSSCENAKVTPKLIKDSLRYEVVSTWQDTIGESNAIIIRNKSEIEQLRERNPLWAKDLDAVGMTSLCLLPLVWKGVIVGYLYVTDYDVHSTAETKELLELTSFFLAAEIASHDLVQKLEKISIIDGLTDCYNRNALIHYLNGHIDDPVGILYADINGLKDVNDRFGHDAGDKLLQKGAHILLDIFHNDNVYRSGGDEFIVICKSDKQTFLDKAQQFRELTTGIDKEVMFSSGIHYNYSGSSIIESMKIADAKMYEDKADFYKLNGIYNARRTLR